MLLAEVCVSCVTKSFGLLGTSRSSSDSSGRESFRAGNCNEVT